MIEYINDWIEFLSEWEVGFSLERILRIIQDPGSNLLGAILLLSMAVVIVLLIALTIIIAILNSSETKKVVTTTVANDPQHTISKKSVVVSRGISSRLLLTKFFFAAFILLLAYAAYGVSSQQRSVCVGCHKTETIHSENFDVDGHKTANCSQCHEGGTLVSRSLFGTPRRTAHFVSAITSDSQPTVSFLPFSNTGCTSCHTQMEKTIEINRSGNRIRVSHQHPLEARMNCTDCHNYFRSASGAILDTGMQSCLVCHDGERTSSSCDTCHVTSPSAPVDRKASPKNAQKLVAGKGNQQCYRCHDPKPCDSCHGVRMPHDAGYEAGGPSHSEEARAVGNSKCYKCHERGMCEGCHFEGGAPYPY